MCPVHREAAFETFHSLALNDFASLSLSISGTSESLDFEIPCTEQAMCHHFLVDVICGY